MAESAIRFYRGVTDIAQSKTHGQFVSRLHDETKRSPAAGAGKFFRKHSRQNFPHVVRNAALGAQANRAVLPVILLRRIGDVRSLPQQVIPQLVADKTRQQEDYNESDANWLHSPLCFDKRDEIDEESFQIWQANLALRRHAQM